MSGEEEPPVLVLKAHHLLSEAQLLMREIEEMLNCFATTDLSRLKWHGMVLRQSPQEHPASIEEDGGTLVIEGFRFESEANRDNLKKLSSHTAVG